MSLSAVCDCGISRLYSLTIFDVSAVGSVKQNLSGKECDKALSCDCYNSLPLPRGAEGWSAVCDYGSCWSYSLTF